MNKFEQLAHILEKGSIKSLFQPVVDLQKGSVFAYEGLSRIDNEKIQMNIENLFSIAREENKLWELETLCRTKILENACKKPMKAKLFINVDANIMKDPEMKTGFTYSKLCELGLEADKIVFEITEKSAIENLTEFSSAIDHYRYQKYSIAVDDYGSGYSGLNRVCTFLPDFVKIDMDLVKDIDKDAIKKSAVRATVSFCKEFNIKVIAEGIETLSELDTLIKIGVDYGQGYFLARPAYEFKDIEKGLKVKIKHLYFKYHLKKEFLILNKIKHLASFGIIFSPDTTLETAYNLIEKNIYATDVFVVDTDGCVIGVVSKNYFKKAFLNNYNLEQIYICDIMNNNFLLLDYNLSIEQAAILAMQRNEDTLYCAIAVVKHGKYIGSVSIKDLLLTTVSPKTKS